MAPFWLDDLAGFVSDYESYNQIIPTKRMTLEEQLNAIMRLSLISAAVFYLVNQGDPRALYIIFFAALFTIVVYSFARRKNRERTELYQDLNIKDSPVQGDCVLPTPENPTMNILPTHYKYFPNRPPACNTTYDPQARQLMYRYLNQDELPPGANHAFYTMPCTQIPDAREDLIRGLAMPGFKCL